MNVSSELMYHTKAIITPSSLITCAKAKHCNSLRQIYCEKETQLLISSIWFYFRIQNSFFELFFDIA